MDRKDFLKKSTLGAAALALGVSLPKKAEASTYDKLMHQVGFNHMPNADAEATPNSVVHRANTRGYADRGWLKATHSFSFANYYNPERMNFGVLRVLNDDIIAPGMGFPTHPHDNMEIITIPLEGTLQHKDTLGNTGIIRSGDVQVMSAGTGIQHSEYNHDSKENINLLQIWLFPNKKQVTPRYDQINMGTADREGKLQQILSPSPNDAGVWIHQNAWFNIGRFDKGKGTTYSVHDPINNGVYAFVVSGSVTINGVSLNKRDAYGIWNTQKLSFTANERSEILLLEVPMQVG